MAMFTFPKHLKGNRIPPPAKMVAIEAQKKLEKQEEESKPQLKGNIVISISMFWLFISINHGLIFNCRFPKNHKTSIEQ